MDLELVSRLTEVLRLDDSDGPVLVLNKAGVEEGKRSLDLSLVGKVIGPKPANKDGIENAMKGVWKLNHRFQVEELSSKNVFRFFFGSREDRQRVYGGGPWTFDKQLICFVKPMGLGEISKMNFDFTSFWISINNVPLACMTELFAREWGERIGKLEDIKLVNGTMKVRVRMNITEPLKRGLRVAVDEQGNEVSLLFQYEHLPDFCFDCGIIGHKALDCPLRDFGGDTPRPDRGRYGSWMCAPSSPLRDRFRYQKKRDNSPSNRPIMSMGEASRILAAVEKGRVRYSGPSHEELAPTTVLEAREREAEGLAGVDATAHLGSHSASGQAEPLGVQSTLVGTRVEGVSKNNSEVGKMMSTCELGVINGALADKNNGKGKNNGEGGECPLMHALSDCGKGKNVMEGECSMDVVSEVVVGQETESGVGIVENYNMHELNSVDKGKGVMDISSQVEVSFTQALQETFEPLIQAQKAKTWKRLNSARGRGSKGKPSSIPISPKLSHVLVANAINKVSPKVGGGGKRKMDVDVHYENVKKGRLEEQSKYSPSLVFLSETKLYGGWAEGIRRQISFSNSFHVDCVGKSGGLLLLWNDDWEVSVKSFSVGHIDALVKCPGLNVWRFTGFYGNPKASSRINSWQLLCRLKGLFDLPWICGGDFNEVLSINEKKGGVDRSLSAISDFQQALDKCDLVDMGFEGQCFTWLNKRQGVAHVQERLDRYFCNQDWHNLFPSVKVINGDFIHSDHRPIAAILENVVCSRQYDKKKSFRFETHWLKDTECRDIVTQTWLSPDVPLDNQDSILDIFGRCADRLGAWNKTKFGSIPKL
ncbi:hypothetical protein F8388_000849, partial [Cannabis sativa]